MATNTALIRIQIDEGNSLVTINGITASLEDLAAVQNLVSDAVQKDTKARLGSEAALKQELAALVRSRAQLATNSTEYIKMSEAIDRVSSELTQLTGNAKVAGSAMQKDLGGAAGIAGATAAEFGRLISDLPYGIQAVTNNISQLGSMFALLVSSSGGVGKAFKNLGSTLLGPAGILIGFQAAVAAIEFFSRSTDKATKSVLGLNAALEGQKSLISGIGLLTQGELEKTIKVLSEYSDEYKKLLENFLASGQASKEGVISLTNDFGRVLTIRRSIEAKEKELGSLSEKQEGRRVQLLGQINQLRLDEVQLLDRITYLQRENLNDLDSAVDNTLEKYYNAMFTLEGEGLRGFTDVFEPAEEEPYFPYVDILKLEGILALEQEVENNEKIKKEREKAAKERLDLEQDTIDALAMIKLAEVDIVETVFRSIADIAEGNRFIQAVALLGESAAGIAKIIIDTQAGNASLRRAQSFAISLGRPETAALIGLKIKANKIAAAAGIAANVGATATALSRLKAPVGSPSSANQLGSAELSSSSPTFNVVGATTQNQLSAAILGSQQKPTRSYVVSSDVTTAQQLDRNIIQGASI